jgi:hypothetical protein
MQAMILNHQAQQDISVNVESLYLRSFYMTDFLLSHQWAFKLVFSCFGFVCSSVY